MRARGHTERECIPPPIMTRYINDEISQANQQTFHSTMSGFKVADKTQQLLMFNLFA